MGKRKSKKKYKIKKANEYNVFSENQFTFYFLKIVCNITSIVNNDNNNNDHN